VVAKDDRSLGCATCGTTLGQLLKCPYCNNVFCREHRWDRNTHYCPLEKFSPANVTFRETRPSPFATANPPRATPVRNRNGRTLGLIVATLIIGILLVSGLAYNEYSPNSSRSSTMTNSSTTSQTTATSVYAVSSTVLFSAGTSSSTTAIAYTSEPLTGNGSSDNPSFVNGSTKIDYPPNYAILANYTLSLINSDRATAGLAPITLSSVPSGQQHADSLAYYGTIGHWDVQGYKPYMRYTMLGGTGYVAENVAYGGCTDSDWVYPEPCTIQTEENALNSSEWFMMNNDSLCCDNGHRMDILDPLHNHVSIGIAYNATTELVYLVEDFENSYITSESFQLSGSNVTLQGTTSQNLAGWVSHSNGSISAGAQIGVFYDPTPTAMPIDELTLSPSCEQYNELNEPVSCEYRGAYNPGTLVTTILAPCPPRYICGSGNFTYAYRWQQSSGNFQIFFSIGGLESVYGSGVYTFYLWPAGDTTEPITSLSVFATG
jgi:hypothetical protein